jgi:FkbM family methyltransferase
LSDTPLLSIQGVARRAAGMLGRDSWLVRTLRPAYEGALDWMSGGGGIPWAINGVMYRADPRFRHMLGQQYDRPVADFLRQRVRPGSVCFDVGANIGVYVLQFAHWSAPTGKVVAFEPNPAAQTVLRRHVSMNGLGSRVEIVGYAVGAQEGEASFFSAGEDGMSRLGAPNRLIADKTQRSTVRVTTLDAYTAATNVEPDWLLMDIEGFEIQALLGARELIRRRRGHLGIVVEMHPGVWDSAETTRQRARDVLADLGLRPVALGNQREPMEEHGLVYLEPV